MADNEKNTHSLAASPALSDQSGKKSRNEIVSRQSGKVTFPSSGRSGGSSQQSIRTDENEANKNPFKIPQDTDIFRLRDEEKKKKKKERLRQRDLKVHEKSTYATKVNVKTASMIRPEVSDEEKEGSDDDDGQAAAVKDDPQFTLAVTRDRHVEKESLADYISKKREMFLVQYSLGVKRDEMQKLEEIAAAEEKKLEMAEQYLEEDAAMFDEFLKENDKNSVEAIKIAEAETKAKLEKVSDIKKINTQMMAVKSDISKYEDTLKEYLMYKKFLENLTPKEWLDEKGKAKQKRREEKRRAREMQNLQKQRKGTATPSESDKSDGKTARKKGRMQAPSRSGTSLKPKSPAALEAESTSSLIDSDEDSAEEPELYFTDPQQMLDIFAELEEQNLSLIQNSQETEEALEETKQAMKKTKAKMENETKILKDQIDKLNNAINKEEEKAKDLKIKAKMFSYGKYQAEDQQAMLASLNKKVEDVYGKCIGDNEANISTLQMLTNIENRLEELFEQIEMMPQDKVELAEKMLTGLENRIEELLEKMEMLPGDRMQSAQKKKEKERRLKLRTEKKLEQKLHQEERIRRALERSQAEPTKRTGRKPMERSAPPHLKKKEDDGADLQSKEDEELAYFFTP